MHNQTLEPEDIAALSQFLDCIQLTHPDIILELFDPQQIQQLGHRVYDVVNALQEAGKIESTSSLNPRYFEG